MAHGDSVESFAFKQQAQATLISAAAATLFATFLSGDTTGAGNLAANVIQLGAPVCLGAAVANLITPPQKNTPTNYITRAAIGGGATAVALIAAGALPMVLDVQLVSLIGLAGASIAVGDAFVLAVKID